MKFFRSLSIALIAAASATIPAHSRSASTDRYHAEIVEMSVEENIAHPDVPKRQVAPVKDRQLAMARHLKSKGMKVETARDGLVVVVTLPTDGMFAPNDTNIMRQSGRQLDMLAHYLKTPDFYKLLIVVHSDDTGSEEYLNTLTAIRAEALSDALVTRGATREAIVTYGFGADEPTAANTTRAGRSANRRVEFYFVPGPAMLSAAKSGKL